MSKMVSLLDRHIGRTVLYSTTLVFAVLLALFTLFEFVEKVDDIGHGSAGLYELVRYLILTLPRKIYELFPMAAVIGTTMGLSSLAVDSELIAMRAAGVSIMQIVGSVLKAAAVLVVSAVLIGEFLAPQAEDHAQRSRAEALHVGILQDSGGVWLRDGSAFINVGEVLPDLSVLRINIYDFAPDNSLRTQTYAESGKFDKQGRRWRLQSVSQSTLGADKVDIVHQDAQWWKTAIEPDMLAVFAVQPEGLSALNLYRYIRHLHRNNQETGRYTLAFWYKLISPFTTAVMVILAVPFVFMPLRSAGVGSRLFIGILLGLGFFVVSRGFGYASVLYGISPFIGAVLPSALFLLLALYLLRRVA